MLPLSRLSALSRLLSPSSLSLSSLSLSSSVSLSPWKLNSVIPGSFRPRGPILCPLSTTAENPKNFADIPGPPSVPVYGTIPDIMARGGFDRMSPIHREYLRDFGRIVKVDLMEGNTMILLYEPADFLKVLQNEGEYPVGAASFTWPFKSYFAARGRVNAFTEVGPVWKERRHALQPDFFTHKAAASYLPLLGPATDEIARYIPPHGRGDFISYINRASIDMFTSVVLGKSISAVHPDVSESKKAFVAAAAQAMALNSVLMLMGPNHPEAPPLIKSLFDSLDVVMTWAHEKVQEVAANEFDEKVSQSFLGKITRKKILSPEDTVTQTADLLLAGVDTTSHVLLWALVHIAANPAAQERLHAEIASVLTDGLLTEETMKSTPYLDAVLRESHRLTPSLSRSGNRPLLEDTVLSGYMVPKGTNVCLMYDLQRDPDVVPDADAFIPERYLDDAKQKRKGTTEAVVDHVLISTPFGAGARMCLGARVAQKEISALVCRLVHRYKIALDPLGQQWVAKGAGFIRPDPFPTLSFVPRT